MSLTGYDIFVQASQYVPELRELPREKLLELYLVIPYETQPDETGRVVYETKAKELNRDPGLSSYDKFEIEITRVTRPVLTLPQVSPQGSPQGTPQVLPLVPKILPPRILPPNHTVRAPPPSLPSIKPPISHPQVPPILPPSRA